jgi:hypothetical protein
MSAASVINAAVDALSSYGVNAGKSGPHLPPVPRQAWRERRE